MWNTHYSVTIVSVTAVLKGQMDIGGMFPVSRGGEKQSINLFLQNAPI